MKIRICRLAVLLALMANGAVQASDPQVPINPNLPREISSPESESRYIVQFFEEPVVKLAGKSIQDRRKQQSDILNRHEQFAQDLQALRGVPAGAKRAPAGKLFDFQYDIALNGVAVTLTDSEVLHVASLPYVLSIEADQPVFSSLADSIPQIGADDVAGLYGGTGAGVLVSVIDTGVDYNHPDLGGGIGSTFKVVGGYDFVNDDSDPMDDHYHGTHVAGIVAADGVVKGVAPGASILAVKVLSSSGSGWSSGVVAGINYSLDPDGNVGTDDGAKVINMSLGSYNGTPTDSSATATNNASAAGVICVAAAGNSGPGYNTILSPASAVSAISVGAVTKTDTIASFSSRGSLKEFWVSKPNLVAPGVSINSTYLGTGYAQLSGTSMAAPHVAGAAALLRELHPTWTVNDVRSALIGTAVDIGLDLSTQGTGRVDVLKATEAEIVFGVTPLDIGKLSTLNYSGNHAMTLRNVGSVSQDVSLSVNGAFLPLGTTATISPTNVTIPAGGSTNVTLSLAADSTVTGPIAPPYLYYGFVNATYGTKTIRNPFTFFKEPPDSFEPNNSSIQAKTITVSETRTQIKVDGQTRIDPTQPNASNPDQDWYKFTGEGGRTFFALAMCASIGSSLQEPEIRLYNSSLVQVPSYSAPGISFVDTRVVYATLPTTGTYYLKLGKGISYAPNGAYNLYVNYLPDSVDYMERPGESYPFTGSYFGHHGIRQVALGDGGNAGYASQIIMPINHYDFSGPHSVTYRTIEDSRPVFLDAARDANIAASVTKYWFADSTWTYNGTTWTRKNPAAKPPRIIDMAMAYDPVRDQTILFGGSQLSDSQSTAESNNETWAWDGTTWTQLSPATVPAGRRDCQMVWDSDREVIVMFGSVFNGETWEWDGTNWTQKTTGPSMTAFSMAYDPVRQEIIVHGNPWTFGAPETWRYKNDTWTKLTPANMPPKTVYDMVWDPAANRILNVVGFPQVTWSWDGTNWTQLPASSLFLGHVRLTYDSARSKIVLVTQPNANNTAIQYNYTYEWSGSAWTQISTPNAMPQMGSFCVTYDSARSETLFFGGMYVFNGENHLTVMETGTQTPLFSQDVFYPNTITGMAVSADGQTILTSHEHGNVEVRNGAGALQRTIDRASAIILSSLSENGNAAVFKEGSSTVIIDLATDTVRSGIPIDAGLLSLSDDATRVLYAKNALLRLYEWGGASYASAWERQLPTAFNDEVSAMDTSGDGSLVFVLGRKITSATDSSQINHYLINAEDGEIINSLQQIKNPQSVVGFMPMGAKVNQDGSLAVSLISDGDKQYPEVLAWNPMYEAPVFQLPLDGAGLSIDVHGQKILTGSIATRATTSENITIGASGRVFLTDLTGVETGKLASYLTGMPDYHRHNDLWATYNAFDLNGNGVANVQVHYSRNGGAVTAYPSSFTTSPALLDATTLGGEGIYEMYTIAEDTLGSLETAPLEADATIIIDMTPPSSATASDQGAYRAAASLTFSWTSATDSGPSGLDGYDFQLSNDSSFTAVIAAGSLSSLSLGYTGTSGSQYFLRARSKDKAGNTSAWSPTDGILVDLEKPSSAVGALPASVSAGTTFTVSWAADDVAAQGTPSGVASNSIYWKKDAGSYALLGTYPAAITEVEFDPNSHGGAGTYSFYSIATDNAGNAEIAPGTADAETEAIPSAVKDWRILGEE